MEQQELLNEAAFHGACLWMLQDLEAPRNEVRDPLALLFAQDAWDSSLVDSKDSCE